MQWTTQILIIQCREFWQMCTPISLPLLPKYRTFLSPGKVPWGQWWAGASFYLDSSVPLIPKSCCYSKDGHGGKSANTMNKGYFPPWCTRLPAHHCSCPFPDNPLCPWRANPHRFPLTCSWTSWKWNHILYLASFRQHDACVFHQWSIYLQFVSFLSLRTIPLYK